jgi:aryl-alcohol dehydrogenase-like predicted oxidoreductase
VKADIEQLHVSSLYGYMFHNYQDFRRLYKELESDLKTLRSEGLINYLGVSVYTNDEAIEALDSGSIDFIQFPFNLLDNINQRGNIIEKAKAKNIEVHVRSVFLQGLFFKNPVTLPEKLAPLQKHLISIQTISSSLKKSLQELALQYVFGQPDVDRILIGVDNISQLDSNLQSVPGEVPEKLLNAVNSIEVQEKELLNPSNW